jgi:nicotinate-nucleotide pyrophosphorylase (carboxylating)
MDIRAFLSDALAEDLGSGDLTTESCVPPTVRGVGRVRAKQPLVVAGLDLARRTFEVVRERLDLPHAELSWTAHVADGDAVPTGTVVAEIRGPTQILLIGERLALNLLMKLSGIATHVRSHVDAAAGGTLRVVDTRKTTPLLRDLEKYAVRCGGASNHRRGLYDGVLVKDNHVDAVGSLAEAVRRARAANHHLVRVQVEVRSLDELDQALTTPADALLLDNLDDATLAEAIRRARAVKPALILEASGNMSVERIARIKHLGLDVVSAGGLIHQATWADLSMKIERVAGGSDGR